MFGSFSLFASQVFKPLNVQSIPILRAIVELTHSSQEPLTTRALMSRAVERWHGNINPLILYCIFCKVLNNFAPVLVFLKLK